MTRRLMKTPIINDDAFKIQLERLATDARLADYSSRAEVRLEESETRLDALETELSETRQAISRTKSYVQQLQELLVTQEANEADITYERAAVLASITTLREAGVKSARVNPSDRSHE